VKPRQLNLFDPEPRLPEGFVYAADFISPATEQELADRVGRLEFKPFEFRGYLGKRRVVSFGWRYDFNAGGLEQADDIPDFLMPLRDQTAAFAGIAPAMLRHALVTEYVAGAEIGWHKDRSVFGKVVGISLLSPCMLRFRRKIGSGWERRSRVVEPRSAYLLQGPARSDWEHSISAVEKLRYSMTFRSVPDESEATVTPRARE
jgi:alkylated DNA repair dioxygenase AlkB